MPYNESHITELAHLKALSEAIRTELDDLQDTDSSLNTQLQTLSARYDANVKASTDSDADYAAEVVDARVDTWGEEHESLGANIRDGQQKISEVLSNVDESQDTLSRELEELTLSRIEESLGTVENNERRREEILSEIKNRIESDETLQQQLSHLSRAILRQSVMLAEIRNALREIK